MTSSPQDSLKAGDDAREKLWICTREQLIDALCNVEARLPLAGPAKGLVLADSMADALLSQLPECGADLLAVLAAAEPWIGEDADQAFRRLQSVAVDQQIRDGEWAFSPRPVSDSQEGQADGCSLRH